jgi:hypothetical protein
LRRRKIAHDITQAFDDFVTAFTKPSQRDYAVLVALAGYLIVWTLYGVVAKGNQDLPSRHD